MPGHHYDEDGDGYADQGLSDPFADRQAAAFTRAEPADLVTDETVAAMYETGELRDITAGPVIPVEEYEAAGWDAAHDAPKTVQEARDALHERVLDPSAPDSDATAYDHL